MGITRSRLLAWLGLVVAAVAVALLVLLRSVGANEVVLRVNRDGSITCDGKPMSWKRLTSIFKGCETKVHRPPGEALFSEITVVISASGDARLTTVLELAGELVHWLRCGDIRLKLSGKLDRPEPLPFPMISNDELFCRSPDGDWICYDQNNILRTSVEQVLSVDLPPEKVCLLIINGDDSVSGLLQALRKLRSRQIPYMVTGWEAATDLVFTCCEVEVVPDSNAGVQK